MDKILFEFEFEIEKEPVLPIHVRVRQDNGLIAHEVYYLPWSCTNHDIEGFKDEIVERFTNMHKVAATQFMALIKDRNK